jgi:Uncharacterized protein conserved in bacteria
MKKYISILRGINVGGHKKIRMDDLRQLFVELGYRDVQTYIQSGNILFSAEDTESQALEKTIAQKILKTFGFEVPVLILGAEDLKTILDNNPFSNDPTKNSSFIHITFLSEIPNKEQLKNLADLNFAPDEFVLAGKAIYLYCPTGYGTTKLTNTFFENKLKLIATTRNLNTATELVRLINQK